MKKGKAPEIPPKIKSADEGVVLSLFSGSPPFSHTVARGLGEKEKNSKGKE